MELRHLRYFVALAEHGNFRRAAERLAMAQPPLSRQIRALERELGCRLVVRAPRGIELTPAGRAFLEQARVTLAAAQRAVDRARVAAPENADQLILGCDAAAEPAIVARALGALALRHPTLRVELHRQRTSETLERLRAGTTQASVVALPFGENDAALTIEPLGVVPLCLAVTTGHPFAGPRPVSWQRLAKAPIVLFERQAAPVLFDTIVGTCQREGVALEPVHRASDPDSALTLVAAGLGVTVVPSGWQSPRSFGVACRPLRPPAVTIAFGLAYRRDARSAAVGRFAEAARAVLAGSSMPARVRARASTRVAS